MKTLLALAFITSSLTMYSVVAQEQCQNLSKAQDQTQSNCKVQGPIQSKGQAVNQAQEQCQSKVQMPAQAQTQGKVAISQNTRELSLSDLRDSCINPIKFNSQKGPEGLKVICTNTTLSWVPLMKANQKLANARNINTAIVSDKYRVSGFCGNYEGGSTSVDVTKYEEVQQVFSIEKMITCKDLVSYDGDLKDICLKILDASEAVDSSLVQSKKTGRTYSVSSML